jgi:hypothetical protein
MQPLLPHESRRETGPTRSDRYAARAAALLLAWVLLVSWAVWTLASDAASTTTFFRLGWHADFTVLTVLRIDTPARYAALLLYCAANSAVRATQHTVLAPFVLAHVQTTVASAVTDGATAHAVTLASTLYTWWDWVMCLFLLTAQIDVAIAEVVAELGVVAWTTHRYVACSVVGVRVDVDEDVHAVA